MKSLKWAFLALTLSTFVLNSCKKSTANTPKVNNNVSFKLNGTAYSTSDVNARTSTGALTLVGVVNTNVEVQIDIYSGLKVGTLALQSNPPATADVTESLSDAFSCTTGTLTVTSMANGIISGTFQFNGTDTNGNTATVTDGTFQTSYTTN